jgi:hypothetical protein
MNIESGPSIPRSNRTRRPRRIVTLAAIAAWPLVSCGSAGTGAPTTVSTSAERAGPDTRAATGYFAGTGSVPVTFTLPTGWKNNGWGAIKGEPIIGLVFINVENIYSDACPSVPLDPPVGPTVDDLASAWANLPRFRATEPSEITVDGFEGKQMEFTVPDYDEHACSYGQFRLMREAGGGGDYWAQAPNGHHRLWILDVDGTRLVIGATHFPDTSMQDLAAIDEILRSIRIG